MSGEALHSVDARLFGQFLEIASWGEPGPEAFVRGDGTLPPEIVDKLRELNAPVIRFPGGTDVDRLDWADRIDRAPGREEPTSRPTLSGTAGEPDIGNQFGYDEFLALAEQLDAEPLLVLNLRDATAGRRAVADAARHAAGLVAYCNAPIGAKLPPDMPDWPAIRAANGRAEPWGVRYFQVGNEAWFFALDDAAAATAGTDADPVGWLRGVYLAYAEAIHAIDPDAVLIADLRLGRGAEADARADALYDDPRMRRHYKFLASHDYSSMGRRELVVGGAAADPDALPDDQKWALIAGLPNITTADGVAVFRPDDLDRASRLGYLVAATEWNWNGWGAAFPSRAGAFGPDFGLATGLGAATYLHGLMRQGDVVRLATQSMMLGESWAISGVYGRPGRELVVTPSALATSLYSARHGDRRLRAELLDPPEPIRQDARLDGLASTPELPVIDAVVTQSDAALFLHLIHRQFDGPTTLGVDLSAFADRLAGTATIARMVGKPESGDGFDAAQIVERPADGVAADWAVELPAKSVTIVRIDLKP